LIKFLFWLENGIQETIPLSVLVIVYRNICGDIRPKIFRLYNFGKYVHF